MRRPAWHGRRGPSQGAGRRREARNPTSPSPCRVAQPQRERGGLHGLGGHMHQLGAERVEVELVLKPGGERVHGALSVIAPSIETTVNCVLDTTTSWLEDCCSGERGDRHGKIAAPA